MAVTVSSYQPSHMFGQSDENMVETLQDKLNTLPASMVIFSRNLRSLYTEYQVTTKDESTKTFLEVRDSARKNGVVYANKILPMTETVIRSIADFSDYFSDLDFDDWTDCLDDIIADVEKAQGVCDILKMMHNTIIVDLKKNEDKAAVGITLLKKMADQYEEEERKILINAKEEMEEASLWRSLWWTGFFTFGLWPLAFGPWPLAFGFFTFGITTLILDDKAQGQEQQSRRLTATAVAKKENADIAKQAVEMTSGKLIPAIAGFINGLEVCAEFLTYTREKLAAMHAKGDKGAKKPYYIMMKKKASVLNDTCLKFLAVTDMMRNNLEAIPKEPNDGNYVDEWFGQQMVQFEKENPSVWAIIKTKLARLA